MVAAGRANEVKVERRSDVELVVSRTFDAPARILYEAFTRPEHMKRWWAPKAFGVTMWECAIDLRVGGKYRYVFGKEGQPRMAFSGVFREVVPSTRLVATQIFEPLPDAGEAVTTTTFTEVDDRTLLELHQRFPSKEALEGALKSGMTEGMKLTFQQLDELAREIA